MILVWVGREGFEVMKCILKYRLYNNIAIFNITVAVPIFVIVTKSVYVHYEFTT